MKEESPVITCPKDKKLVARLRQKLAEYDGRLARAKHNRPKHRHPDFKTSEELDAILKGRILREVLEKGKVSGWDLSLAVTEELKSTFDAAPEAFGQVYDNAFSVVLGYCTNGGRTAKGGSGLPQS